MEIGVYTFADVRGGRTPQERFAQLLEEADLADQVGLDVFGVGEHHRPDYAISAPAVALAAIAARTSRIRLTSAVTVLSSDDPVRVYQQVIISQGVSLGSMRSRRNSFCLEVAPISARLTFSWRVNRPRHLSPPMEPEWNLEAAPAGRRP